MEKDLIKFYDNIKKNGDIYIYEDSKGNYSLINNKDYLYVGVAYLELTDIELKQAIFNKTLTKDIKPNKTTAIRPVDKSTITNKKSDQGTLIDKRVDVYQVWIAQNGFGIKRGFIKKETALNFAKDINSKLGD